MKNGLQKCGKKCGPRKYDRNTNGTNVGLKVIRVSWEFMEWLWMDGA